MKLAIHFARFGPYHLARVDAAYERLATQGWEVIGLETASGDKTYGWNKERGATPWKRVTVFPTEAAEDLSGATLREGMWKTLDDLRPEAVAIAGWGSADARACLDWCRKNDAKAIVMSETREADGRRVWWKEWIKARIIRRFGGALVGGKSHKDYLVKLGLDPGNIYMGYNVVDNEYFEKESERWRVENGERMANGGERRPYFLASNRFIERKNLGRLIEAYARYAGESRDQNPEARVWNLCLLGDGEQKANLMAQCQKLGLEVVESDPWSKSLKTENFKLKTHPDQAVVWMPGFRQIDELPRFYAHAGCFVHPALEEPWGLVINEAMACGLPVISSSNVGAAEELVDDGVNGWVIDPESTESLADAMRKLSLLKGKQQETMGKESRRILKERCPNIAFGEGLKNLLGKLR